MDPVSLILAALVAGVAAGATDTASQAIKDGYAGLKDLIKKRLADKPQGEMVLAEYEKDPETWEKPLRKSLIETGADQDERIVRQAQQVLALINPQQAAQGKYNIQITHSSGFAIGDNAQSHTYNVPPGKPPEPEGSSKA
ncbi:MAG: hypothetical protein M5U01_39685 [Ardenticatenaceae bacterium]|nr:hypothetical protein [Ardenticatenaceae bacterium]HBY96210.1 hypothetical protein [Chloroflexota bacterium]